MGKYGKHHLNQVIRVNSPRLNQIITTPGLPAMWCTKMRCTSLVSFLTILDLSLILGKHQTNPNWMTLREIANWYSLSVSGSWKTRKEWTNTTEWTRPRRKDNTCNLGSWDKNSMSGKTGKIRMKSVIYLVALYQC